MSNKANESVPLINPEAVPMIIEGIRDSVRRNLETIEMAESLIERIEEGDESVDLSRVDEILVTQALRLLVNEKEQAIDTAEAGIAELSQ